jgi:hypothetical protein
MENTNQSSITKNALKQGAILGVVGIILSVLVYVFDVSLFTLWLILILVIVNIGYTIYAGISYRREAGGYLTFQKAFLHGFIMLMTAVIISRIFMIVLANVIDPNLGQTVTGIAVDQWTERLTRWGAPQEKIDETITKIKEDMPKNFTITGLLISIFWPGILISAVIACITALIVKKKEPEIL